MVFELVGEAFPFSEDITGMRYMNKPKKSQIKVELWISHVGLDEPETPSGKESFDKIKAHLKSVIKASAPTVNCTEPLFEVHSH